MSQPVPRGTTPHWTRDYPVVAKDWPMLLQEHETEQAGYEVPDPLGIGGAEKIVAYDLQRRREKAAGYAHIARLAVDGGPVVGPRPIRRRLALNLVGLIGIGICALGIVVGLMGVM